MSCVRVCSECLNVNEQNVCIDILPGSNTRKRRKKKRREEIHTIVNAIQWNDREKKARQQPSLLYSVSFSFSFCLLLYGKSKSTKLSKWYDCFVSPSRFKPSNAFVSEMNVFVLKSRHMALRSSFFFAPKVNVSFHFTKMCFIHFKTEINAFTNERSMWNERCWHVYRKLNHSTIEPKVSLVIQLLKCLTLMVEY